MSELNQFPVLSLTPEAPEVTAPAEPVKSIQQEAPAQPAAPQQAPRMDQSQLTEAEREEQKALREEYIAEFRASFGGILANTVVQYPDGSRRSLEDIKNDKQKKE